MLRVGPISINIGNISGMDAVPTDGVYISRKVELLPADELSIVRGRTSELSFSLTPRDAERLMQGLVGQYFSPFGGGLPLLGYEFDREIELSLTFPTNPRTGLQEFRLYLGRLKVNVAEITETWSMVSARPIPFTFSVLEERLGQLPSSIQRAEEISSSLNREYVKLFL